MHKIKKWQFSDDVDSPCMHSSTRNDKACRKCIIHRANRVKMELRGALVAVDNFYDSMSISYSSAPNKNRIVLQKMICDLSESLDRSRRKVHVIPNG